MVDVKPAPALPACPYTAVFVVVCVDGTELGACVKHALLFQRALLDLNGEPIAQSVMFRKESVKPPAPKCELFFPWED